MRLTLLKVSCTALALMLLPLSGCQNPFDPLSKSSAIRGLSYIDFSLTWDRWDPDPQYDGVVISMEYYNEFGDSLSFHDKPHQLTIEFYTQKKVGQTKNPDTGQLEGGIMTFDQLFFSYAVTFSNSDDDIRIPIEAYLGALAGAGYSQKEAADAFVIIKAAPPKSQPRPQLEVGYPDQTVFRPEEAPVTPNP